MPTPKRSAENTRIQSLLQALAKLYPNPGSELNFSNEYELVVAVVLSAQCTDRKVNEVTPKIFAKYPDFSALANAKLQALERIVRPINYYRTKSRNLIELGRLVSSSFKGELPHTIDELVTLPGVGHKTASVVVSELGHGHALAVDTHVFRVSQRLGLARGNNVKQVEQALKDKFPPELWRSLHHWLILHGRRVCKAQRPLCDDCELAQNCPGRVASKVSKTPETGTERLKNKRAKL